MTTPTDDAALAATELPIPADDVAVLRAQLARRASEAGVVDVTYAVMSSPVGDLLFASTEQGLIRVAFEAEDFETVLADLAARVSPRLLSDKRRLEEPMHQMDSYFAGDLTTFELALDHSLSKGFRGEVQRYLPHIDYGTTESYKLVAEHVGNPRAVRAVGTACATNPHPIVVPCHRVVRSDGGLGQYLGGVEVKERLIEFEREHVNER